MTTPLTAPSGDRQHVPTDQAAPATAHMTPVELLALHDKFMSGDPITKAERSIADSIALAAAYGSAAFMAGMDDDQGTHAMLRAFLTALIDPMSPDLDYLRMDPAAAIAARAKGGAV